MSAPIRDAAVRLAAEGLRVFPLKAKCKTPAAKGWQQAAAAADPEAVTAAHNLGIATGDGLFVIDVDPRHGGDASLLEMACGPLPETLTASTPSGGAHLYFRAPKTLRVRNSQGKLADGIDVRGDGGYVVAPPSSTVEIPGKQTAGDYEWAKRVLIADAPDWLLDLVAEPDVPREPREALGELTDEQRAHLGSALNHPALVDAAKTYEIWSRIGLALLSLGETGRELWLDFSGRAPNGGVSDAEEWWARNRHTTPESDFRSIYALASEHDWQNPFFVASPDDFQVIEPEPTKLPLAIRRGPEILKNPTRVEWLVENELERDIIAVLSGPRGSMKSTLALDWALRVVAAGASVFLLSAEGSDLDRRIQGWLNKFDPELDVSGLFAHQFRLDLSVLENRHKVVETCRALSVRPALTVVDTFSKYSSALDENSNTDVKSFITGLDAVRRAIGGTILLVTHTGHGDKTRARGASALEADTDAAYVASRVDEGYVRVTRERFKSGPELPPLVLRHEQIALGDERTALVLNREAALPARGSKLTPLQESILQDIPPGRIAVSKLVDRQCELNPERKRNSVRNTVSRVLRELRAHNYVETGDGEVWSVTNFGDAA